MHLTVKKNIPEGFADFKIKDILQYLQGPTIFTLASKNNLDPLYISCLIHGNEVTGLLVLQELIRQYGLEDWPRPVIVFVGNVEAAAMGKRHLQNRPDFNRIWTAGDQPEHAVAQEVLAFLKNRSLFAAIDIHNNTGRNPHYSVVCKNDPAQLNLAALFDKRALFFDRPIGSKTEVMAQSCPAIALEAGLPGEDSGTRHVVDFVNTLLHLQKIPETLLSQLDLNLFEILATLKIPEANSVGIGDEVADFLFARDLDQYNFSDLPAGTVIGHCKGDAKLRIQDLDGKDLADDFFEYQEGSIITKTKLFPAMITLDKIIIKSDCLGYLLRERI